MATASRQTLWTEALWRTKVGQCVAGGKGVTVMLIQSDIYRETGSQRWEQTDREVEMVSNLCEEVVPQNVVQVGSVLWDLGKQVGD